MKNILNKLKKTGVAVAVTLGAMLLFIAVVGAGNVVQSLNYRDLGNGIMTLFPFIILVYVIVLNRRINKLSPGQYGFTAKNLLSNIVIGVCLPVIIITLSVLAAVFIIDIQVVFLPPANDFAHTMLVTLWTLFIVGVWEEFFFRGFVFNYFMESKFGFHASALLSSVLFSLMHWFSFDSAVTSSSWYIGIVLLGYLLTIMYVVTKSIWSVVVFHLCWNFCAALLEGDSNGIGLVAVANYTAYSKSIDDFMVVCLAVILGIVLILYRRQLGVVQDNKIQHA
ncbi:hypothetical protein AM493_01325 [Flavobacterium akiainvivens]|uniref:CAAX prenyl protease 2/Lysostaphin resistance protein A-like domain-containing protein n=1 Tax=Flavobacterium akiainvivens TaxID=1202724 RepID=A0A0M8MAW1_9FLAO|nr:type II CAAX endopeptidase family protein [Flavobacterium akiainvivens]KOS04834.1 hypothetical protein AM493_01325 [Flavobacterium akiainvivens]SFQ43497.1 CAAX protease self-immunity [Flavobacterium akiainvivens]